MQSFIQKLSLFLITFGVFWAPGQSVYAFKASQKIKVIATIKPLYSLISNVMGDVILNGKGELDLLVKGGLDPHVYRLKPSNIRQIHNSDVIFYIDTEMEIFLKNIFKSKYRKFSAIALAQQEGVRLIPSRTNKIWLKDEDKPTSDSENKAQDLHIWMDPANARRIVHIIEETLSKLDPDNSLTYIQNAQETIAQLYQMEEDIREKLRPLREKPMIAYHDAFQYFEDSFGLKSVGAIMLKSDQTPSVKHISALKKVAKQKNITCVLGSPGAHPRIATVVMSGTNAGFGIVDPLGLYLDNGPNLYFDMMQETAQNILDCQDKGDNFDDFNDLR